MRHQLVLSCISWHNVFECLIGVFLTDVQIIFSILIGNYRNIVEYGEYFMLIQSMLSYKI